jgi:hypothetical protein
VQALATFKDLLGTGRADSHIRPSTVPPSRFAALEAILEAKKEVSFGGLPIRQTCHLAGPPVYEHASLLASWMQRSRFFRTEIRTG